MVFLFMKSAFPSNKISHLKNFITASIHNYKESYYTQKVFIKKINVIMEKGNFCRRKRTSRFRFGKNSIEGTHGSTSTAKVLIIYFY